MTVSEDLSFFDASDAAAVGPEQGNTGQPSSAQYLVFIVSGMEMAVPLASVSEIVPYERVSELPGSPPYVRGIVHVRERVIPVVDLAVKLCRRSEPTTKRSCILLVELSAEQLPVGIVMDGVATLLDLAHSQIREVPHLGQHIDKRYVEGLIPTDRGMLPIIDFESLFASDELRAVADIANAAAEQA